MADVERSRLFRARQHDLPIRVLVQKMYSKHIREVAQYPKIYKATIGRDMGDAFTDLRSKVNAASKLFHKLTALREADIALDNLRDVVWAAYDLKCISEGQYGLWIEDMSAAGNMLGGWIKSVQESERKS